MIGKFNKVTFLIVILLTTMAPMAASSSKSKPNIGDAFRLLEKNLVTYRLYNDSIFRDMNDEEWVDMMDRRAACFRKMYRENNQAIDGVTHYFSQKDARIPNASYDSLFVCVQRAFQVFDMDNYLVEHFAQMLLSHYEAMQDTSHLMPLYHIAGVCNAEISRFSDPEAGKLAKKYYERNMAMADCLDRLSMNCSNVVMVDFMNYCYMLPSLGYVSASEAYNATMRFENVLDRYKSSLSEKGRKRAESFLDKIKRTSVRLHLDNHVNSHEDSIAIDKFYQMSPFRHSTLADQKNAVDSVFFYFTKTRREEMDIAEADREVARLTDQLFSLCEQQDSIDEFDIQLLCNVLNMSIELMDSNDKVHMDTRRLRVTKLCSRLVDQIHRAYIKRDPFFFESMLGKMACQQSVFRYLPDDKKIDFMMELAVRAQIGTLLHVGSVEHIARMLFDDLLDRCPEQFLGIMGMNSVEELKANRAMLANWIGTAAAFHDIGKIGLAPIITNDFRRLTPREVKQSRLHPEMALRYFGVAPLFEQFKDISLGHHKWYNGKGGYPDSFDNTKSPWRSFIDLVVICDCLDAATDNLSRNYRKSKTLYDVLPEFVKDAGTRYNPVMVKAIVGDKDLCEKLERALTRYRYELLKQVRDKFIK